jgi:CBS domain-containing protein
MTCRWQSRSGAGLHLESTKAERLGVLPGEERPVREIMSRRVVVVDPSLSLAQVAVIMKREGVASVVAQDDAGVQGLLTERDLALHTATKERPATVQDLLHLREMVTCQEDDIAADGLALLNRHRLSAVPVLNRHGVVTGTLSLVDVAAAVSPQAASVWLEDTRK